MDTLLRIFDEPVPAQTIFGSLSATSTAPIDATAKNPSETFRHEWPASVVFHTPPPVDPI